MVSGIQLLGAIFSLSLSYFTFLHFKRKEFTVREYAGWQALWIVFAAATLFPHSFSLFAGRLGAIRPLDLFTVCGFMVIFLITFYNYVNVDKLRKRIEKTVRDLALQDALGAVEKPKK